MPLKRLSSISLKWKLVVPFLFLSFVGTTLLVYVGLTSQLDHIQSEERRQMRMYYNEFLHEMLHMQDLSLALAHTVALNPAVQEAFAARERLKLIKILFPAFVTLKQKFGIRYFHFHTPPANSFLRLHRLYQFGDQMASYRRTIVQAYKTGKPVAGLERGKTGYGIRGVVPVFYRNKIIGTVEVGYSFGSAFLEKVKSHLGFELSIYVQRMDGNFKLAHSTEKTDTHLPVTFFRQAFGSDMPHILISPAEFPDRSILLGQVKDFSGERVAVVEIRKDRTETIRRLEQTRNVMLVVGIIGVIFSFACVLWVAGLFLKPIKKIVYQAREIAEGKRDELLEPTSMDEIGILNHALNKMLESLKRSREQLAYHASMLEARVQERTSDLIESEEKYRTLVENVPLVVYRLNSKGEMTFINHYVEVLLGYTPTDLFKDTHLLRNMTYEEDRSKVDELFTKCFQEAKEFFSEYRIRHKNGRIVYILNHAIPFQRTNGEVTSIDGFMIDVTGRKKLQDRLIRAEELKTLSEVCERLAHEIRNPLVSAGGFARRLLASLSPDDPNRSHVEIIVKEVGRLELILRMILTYLQPVELSVAPTDINRLVEKSKTAIEEDLKTENISMELQLSPDLPQIKADSVLMGKVLVSLFKNALFQMPRAQTLHVATLKGLNVVQVAIRYPVEHLAPDDVEHFFFPFATPQMKNVVLDLPLAKITIHQHGGDIKVSLKEPNTLSILISLPF